MLSNIRIGNICYYVNDIDRTEAFYRDVIGLDVQRMAGDEETGDWLLASIENNIELIFFQMVFQIKWVNPRIFFHI